jgi:hypothetical protein
MTFIRRDVWTLLARDPWDDATEGYARAVTTMRGRAATDPTSWAFQAAIHGSYAAPPPGAQWNECQHASWFFLPWHRMYLYFFERIVRAASADPTWALPYWNYDQPTPANTLPKPLRAPSLPGGGANPLNLRPPRRNASVAAGAQLPPPMTSPTQALNQRTFSGPPGDGFGGGQSPPVMFSSATGALEQTPHNVIHVAIGGSPNGACQGGLMVDPNCAALDPVFWLHHANIDRLWNRWIELGGGRANPSDGAWLTQSFTFYDETGAAVTMTCADVVDTAEQLDYVYDDDPAALTIAMSAQPAGGPPELLAATDEPVELRGGTASASLSAPPSTRDRLAGVRPGLSADEPDEPLFLTVEDIDAPKNPGLVYGVYLNAPPAAREEEREQYRVGNMTLFGIETIKNPARHTAPALKHTFEITGVVANLKAQGRWDPDAINVTFEPITAGVPEDGGAALLADQEIEAAASVPVRIGRIGLFAG